MAQPPRPTASRRRSRRPSHLPRNSQAWVRSARMEWVSLVVCVGCGLLFFLGGECATIASPRPLARRPPEGRGAARGGEGRRRRASRFSISQVQRCAVRCSGAGHFGPGVQGGVWAGTRRRSNSGLPSTFRYSTSAQRSSGLRARPITPFCRQPSRNSWPLLRLPVRRVSRRKPPGISRCGIQRISDRIRRCRRRTAASVRRPGEQLEQVGHRAVVQERRGRPDAVQRACLVGAQFLYADRQVEAVHGLCCSGGMPASR